MTTVPPLDFDPTDPDLMSVRFPHDEMQALRRSEPVRFVTQPEEARAGFPDHAGYWAITKHADVAAVSKDQKNFSASESGVVMRFAPGMTKEEREQSNYLLINHDDPEHTALRKIVSRAFTPRAISKLHESLKERATTIVAEAVEQGEVEFVEKVAAELPLQAIADLLGVPQADRAQLFTWSNQLMNADDPDFAGDQQVAFMEILAYSMALADERRGEPQDDIVTKLVQADVDGRGLTDDEFGFFMILLVVAGNETTRNAISWGMHALLTKPDQWELFKRERPSTTADEMIRWATPVSCFQRTALHDVQVGGTQVSKGDRVGLFLSLIHI